VEAGQHAEWKKIVDCSPIYKSYWVQCNSLKERHSVLEHHWEFGQWKDKESRNVLPWSKVKELLAELYGGLSGGHLGVNKILDKVRQRHYWLHSWSDIERWCHQCDTCAVS
jgi:hypothetical protein